jgi:hypothetical protein
MVWSSLPVKIIWFKPHKQITFMSLEWAYIVLNKTNDYTSHNLITLSSPPDKIFCSSFKKTIDLIVDVCAFITLIRLEVYPLYNLIYPSSVPQEKYFECSEKDTQCIQF